MANDTLETPPTIILQGEQRIAKAKNRLGRKLSKLANAVPAMVRSDAEHTTHCRASVATVKEIIAERNRLRAYSTDNGNVLRAQVMRLRQDLQIALREITMPLYGITYDSDETASVYHVSANVLSDYKREGIKVTLVAFPVFRKYGRIASIKTRDTNVAYCEDYKNSRGNNHAMGYAQSAWRIAHLEGDKEAAEVAYFWLYHGSLRVCKDLDCPCCAGKRRYKARELYLVAFRYLELEDNIG